MRSVAVVSQKGGVGKTTVALNLAFALARRGHRICLVDLDPQGAIGLSLTRKLSQQPGIADVLRGSHRVDQVVVRTRLDTLSLLPFGPTSGVEGLGLQDALADGRRIRSLLSELGRFDLVLCDTPSGFVGPTLGALRAVQHALVPVQSEPIAARTLMRTFETLKALRAEGAPAQIVGLVLTMVQREDPQSMAIAEDVWRTVPRHLMFETVVPRTSAFLEASSAGVPLGLLSKRPPAAASVFQGLAAEVEDRFGWRGKGGEDVPIALVD